MKTYYIAESERIGGGKSYVKDNKGNIIKWFRSFKRAIKFANELNGKEIESELKLIYKSQERIRLLHKRMVSLPE